MLKFKNLGIIKKNVSTKKLRVVTYEKNTLRHVAIKIYTEGTYHKIKKKQ